jgi:hypothetical protein
MSHRDLQSEFGIAYVRAVAHAAGFFTQEANRLVDADGVDLTVFQRGTGGVVRSPRLDLQVKTTATSPVIDPFPHDLEAKNHQELTSTEWQVPRILVVVVVPPLPPDWVEADEDRLVLRRCGYWLSLRGNAPTTNTSTQRVQIPRAQVFHVAPLRALMAQVQAGGAP